MISDEHTLEIFHHIPNAQLQIFANATHMIPFDDPDRFNSIVATFLQETVRQDRSARRHDEIAWELADRSSKVGRHSGSAELPDRRPLVQGVISTKT